LYGKPEIKKDALLTSTSYIDLLATCIRTVTCDRSVVFSGHSSFLHQKKRTTKI